LKNLFKAHEQEFPYIILINSKTIYPFMTIEKKIWTALIFGFLVTSMISVYADPGEARNNVRQGMTRLGDLIKELDWKYGENGNHQSPLEIAAHALWLADQDQNWDPEDPQKPKGPLEKAAILGAINGALEALDKFSKDQEGKPRRLDAADNKNQLFKEWVNEIKQKLEAAKKELEKNFYGTPQHLKDALNDVIRKSSEKRLATSKGIQAGENAAENLCQWQENKQPDPGATPTPPWTPPQDNKNPVPTQIGGKEEKYPKPRLGRDLQKLLEDIYRKNWNELRKLPQHCRGGWARPSGADEAIKSIQAIRALARLLTIQLKPINPSRGYYVYSSPRGGWREFPGGTPVSTGPPGNDIETVIMDSSGPDLVVTFVMNGPIETVGGKEISLLIDRDSDVTTGSARTIYNGLGVDASVGLSCITSSPASWHLQVWEIVKGSWELKEELDSKLWDISDNTAQFTIPDFAETLKIDNHFFEWVGMAYEADIVDVVPDEPAVSFIDISLEEFSLEAQGVDYDLNEDFARYFLEYVQETGNPFTVQLGGPAIHDGLWGNYAVSFMKDEGEYYTKMVHEEGEYTSAWGEVDYCILVFEVTLEGITVNLGGITRFGTRAGLFWLMDHWDIVAPSEDEPLVLILIWVDENENNAVDPDETVEVKVISP
jgi:hypothetical protein